MPEATEVRKNATPWGGLLFAIAAIACNLAFFVRFPLQGMLPWLSLLFAVVAIIFLVAGLKRAFGQPHAYRGKVPSVVLTAIGLVLVGLTGFAFVSARKLPSAATAPQVGQRVPAFTLSDTSAKPVSLDQLLAASTATSSQPQAPAPKAVLLIFYRGYW
jgi:hypothetical protein